MAQVSKYDGLIHDKKSGKIFDPTDMHEVSTSLADVNNVQTSGPMSESRDDKFFELEYQRDEAREKRESEKKELT